MNILKINGQALEGIYVDAAISFNKPAKRVSTYSVPGRNGDLVIDEGTFDNVLITYPVFEKDTFPTEFDEIVNKLAALEGYQRIECSNDPQHYRLGRFVVPQNPTAKRLNRDGYWQLSFDCKPQRWLLSGEEDTEIDANPIDEYSGDIVSFDAVALDEITELKAAIEPIQNLNGYDNPWPAGGGKNLFDSSEMVISGTAWQYIDKTLPAGTYTMSTNMSVDVGITLPVYFLSTGQSAGGAFKVYSGHPVTQTLSEEGTVRIQYRRTSGSDVFSNYEFQIESGSTPTDYAPYSNVCPISGHTEVNVYRTGKNLCNQSWVFGNIDSSGADSGSSKNYIRLNDYFKVEPSTIYTANYQGTEGALQIYGVFYDSNKNLVGRSAIKAFSSVTTSATFTFTTPSSASWARLFFYKTPVYTANTGELLCISKDALTAYEPYTGQTYPIPLGQTVYGGTLDVVSGVLTITHVLETYTGASSEGWNKSGSALNGYFLRLSSMKPNQRIICNMFEYTNELNTYLQNYGYCITDTTIAFNVNPSVAGDTVASWREYLSSHNLQVVYELATPTTVQLTATQVSTLLGANNIWADTGIVEVKVTTPTVFNNPSLFNSKPLIRVYGVGTFRVNDITVTIASHDKPYIDIDCELQECFYEGENMNEYVSFSGNDFPEFQPGDNYMLLASGITKLEVTPRWWIL